MSDAMSETMSKFLSPGQKHARVDHSVRHKAVFERVMILKAPFGKTLNAKY